MNAPRQALLAALATERHHVLAAVGGLPEADLHRPVAPSGWSIAQLLGHLTYDDEIFWIGAVLVGDGVSIAQVCDGWAAPAGQGAEAVDRYREAGVRHTALLEGIDLDGPPAWTPPPEVFGAPMFATGWQVLQRVLVETATHAGHLDLVRELIDGHQHLVLD